MSIDLVIPSNHLILCCPLLLLPSIFPSIRVFFNELALRIWWPKYWTFSLSISPSNEYSGLISFRMDWLDLLAVHGNLKSLLQHHSSKASFFQCSAFFMVQLSYSYMTTGKTIALIRWTFVGKVMSLLFNMLFSICHLIIIESTRKNIIRSNSASQEKKITRLIKYPIGEEYHWEYPQDNFRLLKKLLPWWAGQILSSHIKYAVESDLFWKRYSP